MALVKNITLENGITLGYHRVVSVQNITNQLSMIEIASYVNKSKREEEKLKLELDQPMNIYISSDYLSTTYDKDLNVDSAYAYLKTLDKFADSVDD